MLWWFVWAEVIHVWLLSTHVLTEGSSPTSLTSGSDVNVTYDVYWTGRKRRPLSISFGGQS